MDCYKQAEKSADTHRQKNIDQAKPLYLSASPGDCQKLAWPVLRTPLVMKHVDNLQPNVALCDDVQPLRTKADRVLQATRKPPGNKFHARMSLNQFPAAMLDGEANHLQSGPLRHGRRN
jgi:hypothetical protein